MKNLTLLFTAILLFAGMASVAEKPPSFRERAITARDAGDTQLAKSLLHEAIEVEGEDDSLGLNYWILYEIYFSEGDYQAAQEPINDLIEKGSMPNNLLINRLIECEFKLGLLDEVIALKDRLNSTGDIHMDSLYHIATAYMETGREEEGLRLIASSLSMDTETARTHIEKFGKFLSASKADSSSTIIAEKLFRAAVEFRNKREFEKALTKIDLAILSNPDDKKLHTERASILQKMKHE